MPELRLTSEERTRHAALSPVQAAWLDFVAARPEMLEPATFADLGAAVELEPEKLQPWPLFIDRAGLDPIQRVGSDTLRLVKTVPERLFDGDPERMIELYGLDAPVARGAAALLADPGCLDHIVCRGDFLLGPQGFACCELNVAGNLGGWQVGPWKERLRTQPLVARFLEEQGLRTAPIDPLATLLEHAVEVGLARGLGESGELNLAVLTRQPVPPLLHEMIDLRYREILAGQAPGLAGKVVFCAERQLAVDGGGGVRLGDLPVQLFVDQAMEMFDGPVFRAQAAGRGFAFNGLLSPLLSDKRNLALLSEQAADGDLYDAEERAAISRCIPWTRLLCESFTDRDGERVYLPDFVRAGRERLVIKPADGFGGRDVLFGAAHTPAAWEARVDAALTDGGWVVQELIPSETFLFQAREGGAVPHEIVWGAFVFGDRFGSCLLRGAPAGAGVVNVGRGARRIVLLEVEDTAAGSSPEPFRHEESCDAL